LVMNVIITHSLTLLEQYVPRPSLREVPSYWKLMFDLFLYQFIYEIGFFYTHWMMHSKHLYKWIHKTHHEWTGRKKLKEIILALN
jgi:sterol desaturase/sphingolipid hydroxylase (fatty acid hydroxylase superfamily)